MIHVNSMLVALATRLTAAGLLADSAYPVEYGLPPSRLMDRPYGVSLLAEGLTLEPRAVGPQAGAWWADVNVTVLHWYYTQVFSGTALLELMRAQAAILTAVNSDKQLGGAVGMTNLIGAEVLEQEGDAAENAPWNRIRYTFSVRGA